MFWIAIAAQLSAPMPASRTQYPWFSSGDVPATEPRAVKFRAIVRPDGAVQGCEIEVSSGEAEFDSKTCEVMIKRARYKPARWMDGTVAYGAHRMTVVWNVIKLRKGLRFEDLTVRSEQLPELFKSPTYLQVAIALDEGGNMISCGAQKSIVRTPLIYQLPEFLANACQHAKSFALRPVRDQSGKSVRSVQNVWVAFTRAR